MEQEEEEQDQFSSPEGSLALEEEELRCQSPRLRRKRDRLDQLYSSSCCRWVRKVRLFADDVTLFVSDISNISNVIDTDTDTETL